ncbi:MAG: tRNA (adenosine(37)-N6)-threonylcarbamoyltransferase complex dimerization subunit type 1 TsaB [Flavobacteriales bacterium]|nr:tRNA (adenosine(37)-N6)-threonylcarbamoyltransferase complex dimerization subunit type 1 TsaB [Flavobacteriales bacterium]
MPLILAIETSGSVCSTALFEGSELLEVCEIQEENAHSRLLFSLIQDVLALASKTVNDLDAVALSSGPGSYTGLRIGCSAVKGLAYAQQIPVITISSLEIICRGYLESLEEPGEIHVGVFIDARRQEVFAEFFNTQALPSGNARPYILDEKPPPAPEGKDLHIVGSGGLKARDLGLYPDAKFSNGSYLSARYMGQAAFERFEAGDFADLAYFEPDYLKPFFFQGK